MLKTSIDTSWKGRGTDTGHPRLGTDVWMDDDPLHKTTWKMRRNVRAKIVVRYSTGVLVSHKILLLSPPSYPWRLQTIGQLKSAYVNDMNRTRSPTREKPRFGNFIIFSRFFWSCHCPAALPVDQLIIFYVFRGLLLTCWLAFAGRLRCLVDAHELCKLIRIINDPIGNLLEL